MTFFTPNFSISDVSSYVMDFCYMRVVVCMCWCLLGWCVFPFYWCGHFCPCLLSTLSVFFFDFSSWYYCYFWWLKFIFPVTLVPSLVIFRSFNFLVLIVCSCLLTFWILNWFFFVQVPLTFIDIVLSFNIFNSSILN